VRNGGVSMDLRTRFQVFRRGYEFVRSALNAWWDHGKPDGKHPSAIFRSLTQKLVINDWSLLYEAFGAAFSDRADHVAVIILAAIERIELSRRRPSKADGDSNDGEDISWDEFEVQEVWVLVLSLWRRYKRWLMLVVSHCPELNHEVMAERARRCVSSLPFHSIFYQSVTSRPLSTKLVPIFNSFSYFVQQCVGDDPNSLWEGHNLLQVCCILNISGSELVECQILLKERC
jgi:hypothetical protein